MKRILLLGGGYVLSRLAAQLDPSQFLITSRSDDKVRAFKSKGWNAITLDVANQADTNEFFEQQPVFDVIIDSVPPFHSNGSALNEKLLGVSNIISGFKQAKKFPQKLFYLSTTGVYGVEDGAVVNESSPTSPLSSRGDARLASENLYQAAVSELDTQLTCFRIAAISGPERNPVNSIRSGRYPLIEDGTRFTNRIHVEDLVRVLSQAITYEGTLPQAINCSSGRSFPAIEMLKFLTEKYNLEMPESVSLEEIKKRGWQTMLSNQQVSNELLLSLFPDAIQYPDLTWM